MLSVTFDECKWPKDVFVAESYTSVGANEQRLPLRENTGSIVQREMKMFMILEEARECYEKKENLILLRVERW